MALRHLHRRCGPPFGTDDGLLAVGFMPILHRLAPSPAESTKYRRRYNQSFGDLEERRRSCLRLREAMTESTVTRPLVAHADAAVATDIYIVGGGVRLPAHFTMETLDILEGCHEIYTVLGAPVNSWCPSDLAPRVRSLWHLYKAGGRRTDAYDVATETILRAAPQASPIAYLALGHPLVFDTVTAWLLARGPERGLCVRVAPAISSIDTILVDLGREVAPGLQIYDPTAMVGCDIVPRVDLPCLLIQPSTFGTAYATLGHRPKPNALAPLRDHLLRFYPAEHHVSFVRSADDYWAADPTIHTMPLSNLGQIGHSELANSSLFVPELHKPHWHSDFARRLNDETSLTEAFELL